jgi:hypothetical protein
MPLADDRRLVAGFLHELRKRWLRAVELVALVVPHAIHVTVLAGENYRTAWSADRIRAEAIIKPHPLAREPVNIGSTVDLRAVGAHCIRRMIVGKHKQNVGATAGKFRCASSPTGISRVPQQPKDDGNLQNCALHGK